MPITVEKTLYITGMATLLLATILLVFRYLLLPVQFQIFWPIFFALYFTAPPFKKFVKDLYFKVYCVLVYENPVFWTVFYDGVSFIMRNESSFNQINYGYAPTDKKDGKMIEFKPEFEAERMSLQLSLFTVRSMMVWFIRK